MKIKAKKHGVEQRGYTESGAGRGGFAVLMQKKIHK